jgi:hypothetical protein
MIRNRAAKAISRIGANITPPPQLRASSHDLFARHAFRVHNDTVRGARLVGVLTVLACLTGSIIVSPTGSNATTPTDPPGEFFGVSCVGASYCLAVGTAAATWNGQYWKLLPKFPRPKGTIQEFMNAVSCPVTNDCVVVGGFESKTAKFTLAENWNGTEWTAIDVGATTNAELDGVSCPTSNWCMATGATYRGSLYQALAGTWSGTEGTGWTVVPVPNMSTTASSIGHLSCASSTVCVGMASTPEVWNGQTWTGLSTTPYQVDDVSCLPGDTTTQCTYLGTYRNGKSFYSDTLQYNGSAWNSVGSASGNDAIVNGPSAYSCASATACFAVGQKYLHSTGADLTFSELWNGTNWTYVPSASPNPPHKDFQYDSFFGVTCVTTSNCTAVGRANDDLLAENWNGTKWIVGAWSPSSSSNPGPPATTTTTTKKTVPVKLVLPNPCQVPKMNAAFQVLGEQATAGWTLSAPYEKTGTNICQSNVPGTQFGFMYDGYTQGPAPSATMDNYTTSKIPGFPGATLYASTLPWTTFPATDGSSDWQAMVTFSRLIGKKRTYASVYSSFTYASACTTSAAMLNVEIAASQLYNAYGGTPLSLQRPGSPCQFENP